MTKSNQASATVHACACTLQRVLARGLGNHPALCTLTAMAPLLRPSGREGQGSSCCSRCATSALPISAPTPASSGSSASRGLRQRRAAAAPPHAVPHVQPCPATLPLPQPIPHTTHTHTKEKKAPGPHPLDEGVPQRRRGSEPRRPALAHKLDIARAVRLHLQWRKKPQ